MHSTVHENMLKRLNEEPPTVASEAEEIGYDTQSEEQDQNQPNDLFQTKKGI